MPKTHKQLLQQQRRDRKTNPEFARKVVKNRRGNEQVVYIKPSPKAKSIIVHSSVGVDPREIKNISRRDDSPLDKMFINGEKKNSTKE